MRKLTATPEVLDEGIGHAIGMIIQKSATKVVHIKSTMKAARIKDLVGHRKSEPERRRDFFIHAGEKKENRPTVQKLGGRTLTHRCRVYVTFDGPTTSDSDYTEVWDTTQNPKQNDRLPEGRMIAEIESPSNLEIRKKLKRKYKELGAVFIGEWQSGGF